MLLMHQNSAPQSTGLCSKTDAADFEGVETKYKLILNFQFCISKKFCHKTDQQDI